MDSSATIVLQCVWKGLVISEFRDTILRTVRLSLLDFVDCCFLHVVCTCMLLAYWFLVASL